MFVRDVICGVIWCYGIVWCSVVLSWCSAGVRLMLSWCSADAHSWCSVVCSARHSEGPLVRHRSPANRVTRSQINMINDYVTKTNAKIMRDGTQSRSVAR